MSLTFSSGPLSGHPPETVNYRIDGPAHKLLMQEFPRRVRATFGGETVFDTTRAMLLHETGLLPQVYVPQDDIRADLLRPTDHHTYCPFKGTASYWSVGRSRSARMSSCGTYTCGSSPVSCRSLARTVSNTVSPPSLARTRRGNSCMSSLCAGPSIR